MELGDDVALHTRLIQSAADFPKVSRVPINASWTNTIALYVNADVEAPGELSDQGADPIDINQGLRSQIDAIGTCLKRSFDIVPAAYSTRPLDAAFRGVPA